MFNIEIDPVVNSDEDSRFFRGRITLGDYSESFLASAEPWNASRYEQQWQSAARELVAGAERTAFVTSFVHPDADHNFVWAAWRHGSSVHFQQLLLLRDMLSGVLDVDRIAESIPERSAVAEDGHAISEWVIALDDVVRFVA